MKSVNKSLLMVIVASISVACGKPKGELVGAGAKGSFNEANPYGMVYIKRGSFMMGVNAQPTVFAVPDKQLKVSVDAFWMDETEITNDEYKQFTNWVRDSIALQTLVDAGYAEYGMQVNEETFDDEHIPLNWKKKVPWNSKDVNIKDALEPMMDYDGSLNPNVLRYHYKWINYDQAALPQNRFDAKKGAFKSGAMARIDSSYIDDETGAIIDTTFMRPLRTKADLISERIVCIYPDTLVWVRDYQFAYNEPLLMMYFSHPGYAHYPVIGVTWEQAEAFCDWRTAQYNTSHTVKGQRYRLPTEAEWEYAARGGRKMALYPWGGNYVRDDKGCYLANFKPNRGTYTDDTGSVTMKVGSFSANDFGLYDMAGNVSEWTSSAYNSSSNRWVHDMNPNFQYSAKSADGDLLKRKVVKGGSWKDIAYYLQCGTRTYEYQYEDRSYIGFRCVRSYMGE